MAALIPSSCAYNRAAPYGYPTVNKIYKFNPQGFIANNIGFNDIVRFIIQLPDGYWDAYSTFINLTIDVSGNSGIVFDLANPGAQIGYVMQVDGSCHSFFNSLIIYKDGTELERIMEYDTIASVLQDMNYNPLDRRQREQEGCGGMNVQSFNENFAFPTFGPPTSQSGTTISHWKPDAAFDSFSQSQAGGANPGNGNAYINAQTCSVQMCWSDTNLSPQDPFNPTNLGGNNNANFNTPGTSGAAVGQLLYPSSASQPLLNFGQPQNPIQQSNAAIVGYGFTNPFASNFAQTCMEPKFSGVTCIRAIVNGSMVPTNNITHQFSFPLLSGLLGILMPGSQYKLLPMTALRDLTIEFKMNPYALFTSNPGCTRQYRISKFELVTELVYFDSATTKAIESQLDATDGIVLQTLSWYLGPIYNIAGNVLPGSLQVNLGFESLKSVLVVILRNDYQSTPMARKQYRLTHNVNSFQIKIGTDFFPQQPIQGNASTNVGQNNNSEFYVHMLRAFNKLHSADSQHCIGVGNYAINFSVWNYLQQVLVPITGGGTMGPFNIFQLPGNGGTLTATPTGNVTVGSLVTPSWAGSVGGQFNTQNMTRDIAYYFENSIVGKGLFGIDLEGLNYGGGYILGGVNTILAKPFEILLQYSNQGILFPNNSSVYTFCLYDFMIKLNRNQIVVLGRG